MTQKLPSIIMECVSLIYVDVKFTPQGVSGVSIFILLSVYVLYLLNIRCLSRHALSTPPYFGYSTLLPSLVVKLGDACRLCLGSGQRWGVNRENGGQVVTGLGQRACCSLRYSVMMLSRAGGEGR